MLLNALMQKVAPKTRLSWRLNAKRRPLLKRSLKIPHSACFEMGNKEREVGDGVRSGGPLVSIMVTGAITALGWCCPFSSSGTEVSRQEEALRVCCFRFQGIVHGGIRIKLNKLILFPLCHHTKREREKESVDCWVCLLLLVYVSVLDRLCLAYRENCFTTREGKYS